MEEFYDLEQKIATNPRLDFGTVFNESLELFKKIWGKGALFMLFYLLGSFLLMMLLGMPLSLLGIAIDDVNATGSGFTTLAGLGVILFYVAFFVVIITFVTGLMAGFFHGCKKADEGGEFRTSDYFTFFEGRYLKRTVGVGLATFGVALLSAILCYLPLIYTSIPLSYFVVIYAFNPHLSTTEIVKLAFKLGTNKWGITFASTFVVLLLAYLGAIITCGIGFIFTFSFMLIPRYYIYKGVVGFNTADVLDEIGQDSEFDNL